MHFKTQSSYVIANLFLLTVVGPDGIRDHRVKIDPEPHRYVGENAMSPEGTSEVAYLWRAPETMAHPRPKSQCAGEIGWFVPYMYPQDSYLQQGKGAHIQVNNPEFN